MLTVIAFVITLGVLVSVHEFGHFLVAYLSGVKILAFSIGFGRPIYRKKFGRDATEFRVSILPLGGYVSMYGEDPENPEHLANPRSFVAQSLGKRFAIVAAGPIANFLLAIVLYWFIAVTGVTAPVAVMDAPASGTPAAVAGIERGDEIVQNGRALEAETFELQVLSAVGRADFAIDVRRNGVARHLTLDLSRIALGEKAFEETGLTFLPGRLIIDSVVEKSPAEKSGFRAGDEILTLEGENPISRMPVPTVVRESQGKALTFVLKGSDGTRREAVVTPEKETPEAPWLIGVRLRVIPNVTEVRHGPVGALGYAAGRFTDVVALTWKSLVGMVTGAVSARDLSGPIAIADYAGKTFSLGFSVFASFLALISINLGIFNLLPIPLLDGGHLVYYCVEAVRGRALEGSTLRRLQKAGLFLVLLLTVFVVMNDITRLFS
ncbi:MAG TPA: RIP metalloprotease RseP [Sutterella sp.]|nr:RIP metalloprotease RseP [Sutterella sp.]